MLLNAGTGRGAAQPRRCQPSMHACGTGHVEMVCLMLEDNPHKDFADTDVADSLGRTAWVLASDAGHADIVRLLLEAGPSAEVADTDECTALMGAFDGGCDEIVRLLPEHGVNLNLTESCASFDVGSGRQVLMRCTSA